MNLLVGGPLLTCKGFHEGIRPQIFLYDLVTHHILMQLDVSEVVYGVQFDNRGVTQEFRNLLNAAQYRVYSFSLSSPTGKKLHLEL